MLLFVLLPVAEMIGELRAEEEEQRGTGGRRRVCVPSLFIEDPPIVADVVVTAPHAVVKLCDFSCLFLHQKPRV